MRLGRQRIEGLLARVSSRITKTNWLPTHGNTSDRAQKEEYSGISDRGLIYHITIQQSRKIKKPSVCTRSFPYAILPVRE